ncbi:MAG TPA: S-formylglutathione hydrolase [Sphingomonadales bacterium]|nr:S-formylglutathione hydrolase [Sphingomonadales bacterium]
MEAISTHRAFGGTVGFYRHASKATKCPMKFSVFVPERASNTTLPVLTWLSGLTCTEETFMVKSGAQRLAAEAGVILITPDTSPRGLGIEGEAKDWDFGVGAGFYVNALLPPWAENFRMQDYVTQDLQEALFEHFPADPRRQGIFGHSMGGHGALTLGLKFPGIYKSISAFAPISAPMDSPWGQKAFTGYLGEDKTTWEAFDASRIIAKVKDAKARPPILVDQGLADPFLQVQLKPERLEEGARKSGYPLNVRRHEGYDHGYYFISTFIADHLAHHLKILGPRAASTRASPSALE